MIESTRNNGILTLKVAGRLDSGNADFFHNQVKATFADDDRAVIMDLSGLEYISSAGLRIMSMVAKTLEKRNAKFALHSLSDSIKEVFQISGFDKVINIHASQSQALSDIE